MRRVFFCAERPVCKPLSCMPATADKRAEGSADAAPTPSQTAARGKTQNVTNRCSPRTFH